MRGYKSEELPTTLETEMAENSLKEVARLLNDHKLLAKISGQELIAKELKLHHSFLKSYMSKVERHKTEPNLVFQLITRKLLKEEQQYISFEP